MSASKMPTLAPAAFRTVAIPAATVDFPTPPLPLATAIMFLTPGITSDIRVCVLTSEVILI